MAGREIRRPRRDDHMPALQARQALAHRGDGRAVVDIVEDHQPRRIGFEPAQRRSDLRRVVARLLLRQVQNFRRGERGEAGVQARRVAGAHEHEGRIVGLARPSIFDREPRLAHPAEPVQRDCAAPRGEKRLAQVFERFRAASEQAAERDEGKIAGLGSYPHPRPRCLHHQNRGVQDAVDDRRLENLHCQIVGAREWRARVEINRLKTAKVLRLRGARALRRRKFRTALHTVGGRDEDEVFPGAVPVEADREPRLPLRVGQAPERLAHHSLVRKPRRKLRPPPEKVVDAGCGRRRARHVADEMDDGVAAFDVIFEHGQRVAAGGTEILLDLDLDPSVGQRMAQRLAIGAELISHAGEKQFYVRHSPPPASWPCGECGMSRRRLQSSAWRLRQGNRQTLWEKRNRWHC